MNDSQLSLHAHMLQHHKPKIRPKMETKTKLYQINPSFKFKLSTFESVMCDDTFDLWDQDQLVNNYGNLKFENN